MLLQKSLLYLNLTYIVLLPYDAVRIFKRDQGCSNMHNIDPLRLIYEPVLVGHFLVEAHSTLV